MASTMILFLQATMMAILENLSMSIKTQLFSCLVEGRPNMLSMEINSQGQLGVGQGVYMPCFLMDGLVMALVV